MTDMLLEQLANELRPELLRLNKKYDGHYQFKLLTFVDLRQEGIQPEGGESDNIELRAVVGYESINEDKKD